MKKVLFMLVVLISTLSYSSFASAGEVTDAKIFGVGANVIKLEDMSYAVKTNGKKANEGVVFTPKGIKAGAKIKYSVLIKGKGIFFLKLEESDARGTYIQQTVSNQVKVTEHWQKIELTTVLSSRTSQVDAAVLTGPKEQADFLLKNIEITNN